MLYSCINYCFWYIEANFVVVGKICPINQSRILFSKGIDFLFFAPYDLSLSIYAMLHAICENLVAIER
jgi:hypothetical protein